MSLFFSFKYIIAQLKILVVKLRKSQKKCIQVHSNCNDPIYPVPYFRGTFPPTILLSFVIPIIPIATASPDYLRLLVYSRPYVDYPLSEYTYVLPRHCVPLVCRNSPRGRLPATANAFSSHLFDANKLSLSLSISLYFVSPPRRLDTSRPDHPGTPSY